ncbi:MAG: amidohydrolase family protein [Blastocatellia bacterium]|jgi:predicted TIM-barrel fold metal-dependent hydrolase
MRLIDTHQHVWYPELFAYRWLKDQPVLDRRFDLDDYRAATEGIEVIQSVFVEADVDPAHMIEEARHILALAEQPGNTISGVVAAARPEADGFIHHIEAIAGHPALKGIRRLLQSERDQLATEPAFLKNIESLAKYGLSFDICVRAHQLPWAIAMVRQCPGVQFILDHCGNPEIATGISSVWRDGMAEMASLPNVVCKISGIVVNGDWHGWTIEDLRPAIEWTIDCFGWERVMFGSDWPVCTLASPLRRWVETLDQLTATAGEENRRRLFIENARRVYRLAD